MLPVRFIISTIALCFSAGVHAQSYWQQEVNYSIDVSLNDKQHSLEGFERMEYINHSPDTLRFIWMHLWPNAYKNDRTAFTDQQLQNGNTAFYFSDPEDKGYINKLNFKVDDVTAETVDHPNYIDIVQLMLPSPLLPGRKIMITTPFHVQLPYNFSRGGHIGESYQATQWYPKPAVYDRKGWHPMPYLDQGEFYSEFGSFDVRITVPGNYVVAATGELQDDAERNWLRTRSSFDWKPEKKKIRTKAGSYKTVYQEFPSSAATTKTITFKESRIHDFAWFADKRFIVDMDTCRLPSGKLVDVAAYYLPEEKHQWQHSLRYAKDAVRNRSSWIGEYPYKNITVVQGPKGYGAGMEYPTITLIPPAENEIALDKVIEHEIGHNWFYGILASNERQYPWMDEGLNSYYENRHSQLKYPSGDAKFGRTSYHSKDMAMLLVNSVIAIKKDQPVNTPSDSLSELNYGLIAYLKTAEWLSYLEKKYGRDRLDKAIQAYYEQWKFKHPQPEDLQESISTSMGVAPDSLFSYLGKTGPLPGSEPGGTRFVLAGTRSIATYISSPVSNLISIGPAIGMNKYDNFAPGLFITNYKLPASPLQFFIAPMYSTGTKKLAGTGLLHYSFHPENSIFRKIRLGVSAAAFGINEFKDTATTTSLSFHKVVPSVRFVLKEKNPRSTMNRYIQFKTFMISEDALRFYNDTTIVGTDTSIASRYRVITNNRTLNQLMLVWENNRALYPYRGELKIEQGTDFVRAGFTGNYFFNYAKGGGLDLRVFAGKFFYTDTKTFSRQIQTDRYHLNMTGANGREDYTYSDYFAGRNEFQGTASQQIMVRDGAFKVRTDLLADKVGKTDNWLAAINLSSSIPSSINPLSLLPVKIPLKIFLDIGTYADAWKRNSNEDRFLYDAGLQIPLLNETVNIYIPLLYSSVYKDYINSTIPEKKFWKKISFSIDISHFSLRRINRNLALE
ncbi:MAG: M1 family metallopeptidase [Chitinophagaceae bacterium]